MKHDDKPNLRANVPTPAKPSVDTGTSGSDAPTTLLASSAQGRGKGSTTRRVRALTPLEIAKAVMWHWNGQWLVDEVAFVKAVHLARSESTDDAIDLLTRTKRVK